MLENSHLTSGDSKCRWAKGVKEETDESAKPEDKIILYKVTFQIYVSDNCDEYQIFQLY